MTIESKLSREEILTLAKKVESWKEFIQIVPLDAGFSEETSRNYHFICDGYKGMIDGVTIMVGLLRGNYGDYSAVGISIVSDNIPIGEEISHETAPISNNLTRFYTSLKDQITEPRIKKERGEREEKQKRKKKEYESSLKRAKNLLR